MIKILEDPTFWEGKVDDFGIRFDLLVWITGNALEWVQQVHEPADPLDITFCTHRF